MTDTDETESGAGDTPANTGTDDTSSNEGLAALLLRLLGVYFLGWAIITGAEEAVRLLVAANKFQMDEILPAHWAHLASLAAQFALGAYLLFAGQWVFEKVLLPIVPAAPNDDDHSNEDPVPPSAQREIAGSPDTTTE